VNAEQASKRVMWEPTRLSNGEGRRPWRRRATAAGDPTGVVAPACMQTGIGRNTGSLVGWGRVTPNRTPARAGPDEVAEGPVVPGKPDNTGGGKGPWFKVSARSSESQEIGIEPTTSGEG